MHGIQFADSITRLGPEFQGTVLVTGSHGGRYCGYLAALAGLRGMIANDAGVGKDQAGIGALDYLQQLGVATATVAHTSARIGDGADILARGRQQPFAFGAQRHAPPALAEQLRAGLLLEPGDLLADRRGRPAHALRRRREAPGVRDGDEGSEAVHVEIGAHGFSLISLMYFV